MKTAYYYLYYRIYSFWKRMPGKDHAFSAMAALCLIICYNIVSLIILVDKYYDIPIKKGGNLIIVFVIILFVSNYFIFIHKARYKKIEGKFKNESKVNMLVSSVGTILFVLFTVLLGIFSLAK